MLRHDMVSPTMTERLSGQLIEWRNSGCISETVFNKITRENAIRLLELD